MRVREGVLACSMAVAALSGVLPWRAGWAADPTTWTLMPPTGRDYHKPGDTYRIFVPPDVPVEQLQQVTLELDGIDVTAMVSREGNYAVFSPPQALTFGKHRLRLVQNAADGSINELGLWTFEVRKTALFREANAQTNVDLNVAHRVSDHNLNDLPRRGSINGSATLDTQVANGDWRATGNLQLMVDNLKQQTPNRESVDMASFLVSGQMKQATLNIGHHSVDASSLVLEGFNRRGVSGTYASQDQRYAATAFTMHTNDLYGFRDGLGVGDPANRTTGMTLKAYPFKDNPDRLYLQGVYLQGKGVDTGTGVYGSPLTSGGDAWSVAADSNWLERRMRVRAEYAATRYDFDGLNSGYGKESDDAQSYLVQYTPWLDKMVGNQPLQWNFGVNRTVVGRFFHSIANPGIPTGKESTSLFTNLNWAAWSANASLGREFDNVEDDPTIPTTRTDLFALNTTYTPQPDPNAKPPTGWARLFAQPSYSFTFGHNNAKFVRTPAGFSGYIVDNTTNSASVTAAFTPGRWNWSIGHSYTQVDDRSGLQPNHRDNLTSFNSSIVLGERVTGSASVSWDVDHNRDTDVDTKGLLGNLDLSVALVPNRLTGHLVYNLNRNYATDDSVDTRTATTTARLTWSLEQAHDNRPGAELYVDGTYVDTEDRVTPSASGASYQVFVGLNVHWPAQF